MPLYNYHCDNCNKDSELFNTVEKREYALCECGSSMKKIFSLISKPVVYDYYSENLGARVTGPQHKRRLMQERNVREA